MKKCGPWAPSALLMRCAVSSGGMRHTLMAACRLLLWTAPQPRIFRLLWGTERIVPVAGAVRVWQGGDALLGLPDAGCRPRHGETHCLAAFTYSISIGVKAAEMRLFPYWQCWVLLPD
jgi:hypothetical protein